MGPPPPSPGVRIPRRRRLRTTRWLPRRRCCWSRRHRPPGRRWADWSSQPAGWPRRRCSAAWAPAPACRWRSAWWSRWCRRSSPAWRAPGRAAAPSASPRGRRRCREPRTACSLRTCSGETGAGRRGGGVRFRSGHRENPAPPVLAPVAVPLTVGFLN